MFKNVLVIVSVDGIMAVSPVTDVPAALRSGMRMANRHFLYGTVQTLFEGTFDAVVLIHNSSVYNATGDRFSSGTRLAGDNPFRKRDFEVRVRVTLPYGLNRGPDDSVSYHLESVQVIDHRGGKETHSRFRERMRDGVPKALGDILGFPLLPDEEKDTYKSVTDFAPAPQTPSGHALPLYGPERSENPGAAVLRVLTADNKLLDLQCRLAHEISGATLDRIVVASVDPLTMLCKGELYAKAH
jgi:hypothetical protein